MDRYENPDVLEFISAAARRCGYPVNFGEVVTVLHALGYSLPSLDISSVLEAADSETALLVDG